MIIKIYGFITKPIKYNMTHTILKTTVKILTIRRKVLFSEIAGTFGNVCN